MHTNPINLNSALLGTTNRNTHVFEGLNRAQCILTFQKSGRRCRAFSQCPKHNRTMRH